MTRTAPTSLRRTLAMTTALGMSLGVFVTPAVGQTQTGFGTVASTQNSAAASSILPGGGAAPTITSTPNDVLNPAAGNALNVVLNAKNTIVNWNDLNVPANSSANFSNNGATTAGATAVLNRVTAGPAGNTTTLAGSITADHTVLNQVQVWFINTNGLVMGATTSANYNTAGLVLSTLNLTADSAFLNGGPTYAVQFAGTTGSITGGNATNTMITTNGGSLIMIAPVIQVAGKFDAGAGQAAFAVAEDLSFTATPGSPLAFTLNRGTSVDASNSTIVGTVSGDRVYAIMSAQNGVSAMLGITADVTAASVTGNGVVVLGGKTSVAGSNVDFTADGTALPVGPLLADNTGTVTTTVGKITNTGGTVLLASNGALSGAGAIGASTLTALGVGDVALTSTGNAVSTLNRLGSSGGSANLTNSVALTTTSAPTASTDLTITNTGLLTINGATATSGVLSLTGTGITVSGTLTSGTGMTLNAGSGTLATAANTISVGNSYDVTAADFTGTALAPTFGASGVRNFSITDTAGGLTVGGLTAPGTLTIVTQNGGVLTTTGTLASTNAAVNLTGAGGISLGGNVQSSTTQSFTGAVTLTANSTLTAGAGTPAISFNSTVDGAFTLATNTAGTTSFGGAVGGGTALAALDIQGGATSLAGNVTTTGSQGYAGQVQLQGNAVLAGTTGTLNNGVAGNTHDLTLNFSGADSLGGGVSGVRDLKTDTVAASGTTTLNGSITTTQTQVYNGAVALGSAVTLISSGSGTNGAITLGNTVGGAFALDVQTAGRTTFGGVVSGVASIVTDAPGTTAINANITTTGTQTYNDGVLVGANVTLGAGANLIKFASTVAGAADGAQTLTLSSPVEFDGNVGGTSANDSRLSALTANGTTLLAGTGTRTIRTSGAQTYTGALTLNTDAVLVGSGATFTGTIVGNGNGTDHDLTLSFTGNQTLDATTFAGVRNLTADAGGTTTLNGTISTSGTQTYADQVVLGSVTVTTTSTGVGPVGLISFNGGIESASGTHNALVVGGNGTAAFNTTAIGTTADRPGSIDTSGVSATAINTNISTTGAQTYSAATIGGAAAVTLASTASGAVTFNGTLSGTRGLTLNTQGTTEFKGAVSGLPTVTTDAGGGTTLTTNSVSTTGAQVYGDAVTLTQNTVLAGTTATFTGGVAGAGNNLTLNMSGDQHLGGNITGVAALDTDAAGRTIFDSSLTTTGTQTYRDPAVVGGANVTLGAGANLILFGGTVAGAGDGAQSLTLGSPVQFNGDVGGTSANDSRLATLTANGIATTGGTGTRTIRTSGAQTYTGLLTLGTNTVLIGSGATFTGGVDGVTGQFRDLTLTFTGNSTLASNMSNIGSLTVNGTGATTIASNVTTRNAQTYLTPGSPLVLGANVVLTSTNGGAIQIGTLTGAGNALTVNTGGTTTFTSGVTGLSTLTTDAAGTTVLNGTMSTTGAQTYNDNVQLGSATTVQSSGAGALTFGGTVSGAQALIVNTTGQTTFGSAVGTLTSLNSTGSGVVRVNGGSIATTGTQSYTGLLRLGANTQLTGSSGSFTGGIDGNGFDLRLSFTSPVAVGPGFGGIDDLVVDNAANLTGTTTTTGSQQYSGAVTLTGATTLNAGTSIGFGSTVNGANSLTTNATTTVFSGDVGQSTALTSLTVTGTAATAGTGTRRITTSGVQTYNNALNLGLNTVLTGQAGVFTGGVNGSASNFGLTLTFSGANALSADLFTNVGNLLVNGAGTTTLNGNVTTVGSQTWTSAINVAAATTLTSSGNAAVTLNTVGGSNALTIATGGATSLNGTVTGLTALTTDAGGTTTINTAGITTSSGKQTYNDNVILGVNTTLTASGAAPASGIIFNGTLTGAQSLTATSLGQTAFNGVVGATLAGGAPDTVGSPVAITVTGPTTIGTAAVTTATTQTYGGLLTLAANTVLTGTTASFNGIAGGGFDLTLNMSGAQALTGNITGIRNLTTDAPGTLALSGTIVTTGTQSFGEAVTLAGATTLNAGGTVNFASTVDGGQQLATNATATTFNGDVGGGTALTSLTVTGTAATAGAGTRTIRTTGVQTYNNALNLGVDTVLVGQAGVFTGGVNGSASNFGLTLTFSGANALIANPFTNVGNLLVNGAGTTTLNGNATTVGSQTWTSAINVAAASNLASSGNAAITLNAVGGSAALGVSTTGATNLNGTISGITALSTDAGGTTTINTASIITSSGRQTYGDNVVLGTNTTLTANGAVGTAGVTFNGTVTGPRSLSIASAGTIIFNGVVGATAGGVPDAAVSPTSLTTTGTGLVRVNSGAVTTSGTQTYAGLLQLGANTVLTGMAGSFNGGIDGNGFDLRLVFTNAVNINGGNTSGIDDLLVDNAANLTGTISVTGSQTYNGAVTLTGNTVLQSTAAVPANGAITLASTVNAAVAGGQSLTVTTPGVTSFGSVGAGAALAAFTVNGPGAIVFNGPGVTTTGAQGYTGPATLAADNLLTTNGGNIAFAGTVDGPFQLSVRTSPTGTPVAGAVSFGQGVGGNVALTGLAIRANTAVAGSSANRVGTLAASVNSGGFAFTNAAALQIGTVDGLVGVSTGTGAATITSGDQLTVAQNVTGNGVTLTGTGNAGNGFVAVVQNAARTINAGAGTITIDGNATTTAANDGAIALAGNLVTTNGGASAVAVRDATDVQLNTISAAGGTLTLGGAGADGISGNVTQLTTPVTTITAGSVAGNVAGSVTLDDAGNAIGAIGALTANGVTLRTTTALTANGPVNAGNALTLNVGGGLALQGAVSTTGTATFTVGGAVTQAAGSVVTADTLTGTAGAGVTMNGANQVANLGVVSVTTGGFALTDARSLTVAADENINGNLSLTAIGLDFTGRTLVATGNAMLAAGTGALVGDTVTAANITGSGDTITIDTANAGTTPTGTLTLTAQNGLSLRVGNAGQAINLATTGGMLTLTGTLTAGTAGNTASVTQITTSAGGATTIASAVSNNGGISITGASATIDTAAATNGALAITTTNGALSLGTGSAGTTATLSATGTTAAAGTLDVTGMLTSGGNAHLTATGAATVASIESMGGSVLVRGASASVPFAKSKTTLTVQATAGDVSLTKGVTTGPGGNASVVATGNVALGTLGTVAAPIQGAATVDAGGMITGTSVVSSGQATLTAGGAIALATLQGAGASATGSSVDVTTATATGALLLRATGGTVTLANGTASGTADLVATGDVILTGGLQSGNTATLTSTAGAVRAAQVVATGGDINITAATGVDGNGGVRADLNASGADGDVRVTTGGLALLGPVNATLTSTVQADTIDLSTVTTGGLQLTSTGSTTLGSGTVGAALLTVGGALNVTSLTATNGITGTVGGPATIDTIAGSDVNLTMGSATITSATATTGALTLRTLSGNLTLGTGAAGSTASLQSAGTLAVTTSLIGGNTAANGNVSTLSNGATTIGLIRSKTGSVSVIGSSADVATANAASTLLIRGTAGDVTLGTGTATSGAATLDAVGATSNVAVTTSLTAASAVLTAGGAATIKQVTTTAGTLGVTTGNGALALDIGSSQGAATLSAAGPLTITTSLTSANSATTTSTGVTTIAAITANGGAVSVTGSSADVTSATSSATLAIRGTAGNVTLGTGQATGAATLDAVGAGSNIVVTNSLTAGSAALIAGGGANVKQVTTTAGTLGITTGNGALVLGTGMSQGAAMLSATGPLSITTSLTSANSATTTSTGATTIAAITANGGAVSVTGASADVTNATSSSALLIRGTAGNVTLGTGQAAGAATLDAVGANSNLAVTNSLTAASAALSAGGAANIKQVTTTAGTLGITTGNGALVLGTGMSQGAASLSAAGPLTITTSLTSANSATTTSTGATTIAAITANGGPISVTGASADVTNATSSSTLLIRGTAGSVTLGTGTATGTATLDAVGASSNLGVTTGLTAASATLTAGGAATVQRVTTTAGAISVQAASANVTNADARTTLAITTTGGALTLGTGVTNVSGSAATLNAAGPLTISNSLTSAGAATTTSTGATTIGSIIANGGAVAVTGQSINATTARGATTLDLNATGGNLTVGSGTASNGAATLRATGTLGTTSVTATGAASITAGGAATLGTTTSSGGAVTVNAASIAAGATTSASTVTMTATGALSVTGNVQTVSNATFDAGGTASLAQVVASGAGSTISIKALDAAITGAQRAGTVVFTNRTPSSNTFKLGDSTSTGGFALSAAEINLVDANQLTIDGGTGNVEFGALAFNAAAGRTRVDVLSTGRIDVSGAVTGSGAGRVFRLGGTSANTTDKANVIRVVATVDAGGRLLFDTADLDLRGVRIGVGQAMGFLDPIGFGASQTGQSASSVGANFIGNPNSSLYNSTYGGAAYTTDTPLVSARSMTVRYTDYALFQNTGAPGINKGAVLGSAASPAQPALVLQTNGNPNAFAIFGSINGITDTGAAVSGSNVIQLSGADLANTRINGCIAGSGAGCLTAVVSQPLLNIFDSSRLAVFRAADDLALPFDPVVGTNNEALFSGFGLIDGPSDTECADDTTSPNCAQNREQHQ